MKQTIYVVFQSVLDLRDFVILVSGFVSVCALLGIYIFANHMGDFRYAFNTFGWSCVTVFQITTVELWTEILAQAYKASGWWGGLYIIFILIIGRYVLQTLFAAVILINYHRMANVQLGRELNEYDDDDEEVKETKQVFRAGEFRSPVELRKTGLALLYEKVTNALLAKKPTMISTKGFLDAADIEMSQVRVVSSGPGSVEPPSVSSSTPNGDNIWEQSPDEEDLKIQPLHEITDIFMDEGRAQVAVMNRRRKLSQMLRTVTSAKESEAILNTHDIPIPHHTEIPEPSNVRTWELEDESLYCLVRAMYRCISGFDYFKIMCIYFLFCGSRPTIPYV
jgi:hypothetical protein